MSEKVILSNYISRRLKNKFKGGCIIALFGSAVIDWDSANDIDVLIVARNQEEINNIITCLRLSAFCKEKYNKNVDIFAMTTEAFYRKLKIGDVQIIQCILEAYDLFCSGVFAELQQLQVCKVINIPKVQIKRLLKYCSAVRQSLEQNEYMTTLESFMHLRTAYRFLMCIAFIDVDNTIPRIRDFRHHKLFLIEIYGNNIVEDYFKFEKFTSNVSKNIYKHKRYPTEAQLLYWYKRYYDAESKIGDMYL